MAKKSKCKFRIKYHVSGEAFLTKPNQTTYMVQDTIKKLLKLNLNYQLLGEHLMLDL